jgi:F-type H+-transporting ATPase subunit alpha
MLSRCSGLLTRRSRVAFPSGLASSSSISVGVVGCGPLLLRLGGSWLQPPIVACFSRLATDAHRRRTRERNLKADANRGNVDYGDAEGHVVDAAEGIAIVRGLRSARVGDMVDFTSGSQGRQGLVMSICTTHVKVAMLEPSHMLKSGDRAALGQAFSVPTGDQMLGHVVDGLGRPLQDTSSSPSSSPSSSSSSSSPCSSFPLLLADPSVTGRARLSTTLHTGIKHMDVLHPVARGSTLAVVGPRRCGKSRVALDLAMSAAADPEARVVYVTVGKTLRETGLAQRVLREHGMLDKCTIVEAGSEQTLAMQHLAVMTGNALAAHWRDSGKHALVVYDDISLHANAYLQLYANIDREINQLSYIQGKLLDGAAQMSADRLGGSSTAVFTGTPDLVVAKLAIDNLCSWADAVVHVSHEAARDYYPAFSLGALFEDPPSRFSAALFRAVMPDFMRRLRRSLEASTRAELATELGLEPEIEEEDIAAYQYKLQEALHFAGVAQSPREQLALLYFFTNVPYLSTVHQGRMIKFETQVFEFLETRDDCKVWWAAMTDLTLDSECPKVVLEQLAGAVHAFRQTL